jgi:hypothetical protein
MWGGWSPEGKTFFFVLFSSFFFFSTNVFFSKIVFGMEAKCFRWGQTDGLGTLKKRKKKSVCFGSEKKTKKRNKN